MACAPHTGMHCQVCTSHHCGILQAKVCSASQYTSAGSRSQCVISAWHCSGSLNPELAADSRADASERLALGPAGHRGWISSRCAFWQHSRCGAYSRLWTPSSEYQPRRRSIVKGSETEVLSERRSLRGSHRVSTALPRHRQLDKHQQDICHTRTSWSLVTLDSQALWP